MNGIFKLQIFIVSIKKKKKSHLSTISTVTVQSFWILLSQEPLKTQTLLKPPTIFKNCYINIQKLLKKIPIAADTVENNVFANILNTLLIALD